MKKTGLALLLCSVLLCSACGKLPWAGSGSSAPVFSSSQSASPGGKTAPSFEETCADLAVTLPEVQRQIAYRFAKALYEGDTAGVAACVFGEGVKSHVFDFDLAYPLENLNGFVCTEFSLYGGEFEPVTLMMEVQSAGATPFRTGRETYALEFDKNTNYISAVIPMHKNRGQENDIWQFRAWCTAQPFAATTDIPPRSAALYIMYLLSAQGTTFTAAQAQETAMLALGLSSFDVKSAMAAAGITPNSSGAYEVIATDGAHGVDMGWRIIDITISSTGRVLTLERYSDGLCLVPVQQYIYTQTENKDGSYCMVSCVVKSVSQNDGATSSATPASSSPQSGSAGSSTSGAASTPAQSKAAGATVRADGGLRLRSGAGTGYDRILTIPDGTHIDCLAWENGWIKTTYQNQTGYVSAAYLLFDGKVQAEGGLRLRSGPGESYAKLLTIPDGTVIRCLDRKNGWIKTTYNGKTGYVSEQYLVFD